MSAKPQSKAVESLKQEQREQDRETPENTLKKALEDSFPASDPVSQVTPTKAGSPKARQS